MNTEKQSGMQDTEPERLLNDIFETLGKDFVLALAENTKKARAKHPIFAYYEEQKFEILHEEFEEVRQAFYTEIPERLLCTVLNDTEREFFYEHETEEFLTDNIRSKILEKLDRNASIMANLSLAMTLEFRKNKHLSRKIATSQILSLIKD